MPDLAASLAGTVVFLFGENDNPLGTGFMVAVPVGMPNRHVPVIVTAKHVVSGLTRVNVRFSTPEGKTTGTITYDLGALRASGDAWEHVDEGVDIFVFRTPPVVGASTIAWPYEVIATRETFASEEIKPPDRVVFPHLLTAFMGTTRNYPVIRDGTIALLAEEPIPMKIQYGNRTVETRQELILIDATSIPGASGCPVFLWPSARLRNNNLSLGGGQAYLIGVMHGFYQAAPRTIGIAEITATVPYFAENSRIAIVFPSWRLREILGRADVQKRIEELTASERAATNQTARLEGGPGT